MRYRLVFLRQAYKTCTVELADGTVVAVWSDCKVEKRDPFGKWRRVSFFPVSKDGGSTSALLEASLAPKPQNGGVSPFGLL